MYRAAVMYRAAAESILASTRSVALVCIIGLASTGCYRTRNVVHLAPLETSYPVSASSHYLDASGATLAPENYEVLSNFSFERTIEVKRHSQEEAELALESELDQYVKQAGGDAVTHLKVVATDYDAGAHYNAASWKMMGWSFGLIGVPFVIAGAASSDSSIKSIFLPMGGAFVGVGALSYALSFAANKPARWTFQISGTIVRGGAAAPEPVEGEAVPATESAPIEPAVAPSEGQTPTGSAPASSGTAASGTSGPPSANSAASQGAPPGGSVVPSRTRK